MLHGDVVSMLHGDVVSTLHGDVVLMYNGARMLINVSPDPLYFKQYTQSRKMVC